MANGGIILRIRSILPKNVTRLGNKSYYSLLHIIFFFLLLLLLSLFLFLLFIIIITITIITNLLLSSSYFVFCFVLVFLGDSLSHLIPPDKSIFILILSESPSFYPNCTPSVIPISDYSFTKML